MATTRKGDGFWIVTASGSVVPFGAAADLGSLDEALPADTSTEAQDAPAEHLAVAIAPTRTGHGYWIVCSDGTVAGLGDAANVGDVTSDGVAILAAASRRHAPPTMRGSQRTAG